MESDTDTIRFLKPNMFIAHYSDGKTITEQEMTFDKIPDRLTNLQMALPVKRMTINPETKQMVPAPAPTITLGKYDAYFYEHEAVAKMMSLNGIISQPKGEEVARIIGGIDYRNNLVVQIRVDKQAFITVSRYPLSEMRREDHSIKKAYEFNTNN